MPKILRHKTKQVQISFNEQIWSKFRELAESKERTFSNYLQYLAKKELEAHGLIKTKKIEKIEDVEF